MTTDELSREVAEILGDDGFLPAETCPQGHAYPCNPDNGLPRNSVGMACYDCIGGHLLNEDPPLKGNAFWSRFGSLAKRLNEHPDVHPEWRIGRGDPKPYAEDVSLASSAERVIAARLGATVRITIHPDGTTVSRWHRNGEVITGIGLDEARARCDGVVDAVERWGA